MDPDDGAAPGRTPPGGAARRGPSLGTLLMALGLVYLAVQLVTTPSRQRLTYSGFLAQLDSGNVTRVVVGESELRGTLRPSPGRRDTLFTAQRVADPALADTLRAHGVAFDGAPRTGFFGDLLVWFLPVLVMVGFWNLLMRRTAGQAGLLGMGKSRAKVYVEKDTRVTFADVAGVDEAEAELQEIVAFLRDPAGFGRLGARMPRGVLLVGPPGTGKTLLARAVAGEAGVPFFSINGSEFVEMFVGLGAARVRSLFEQARESAPCIIFIDEIDALGRARGSSSLSGANDEKEQTLNQLLAELDGFDVTQGIVLLAATNRPEILDPALLRAGRFDRQVLLDPPDRNGRVEILRIHSRKVKLASDADLDQVAGLTPGFSGAELANLVNEAALIATRRNAPSVSMGDFTNAIERIVAGLERRKRLLNPEERRRVACHEMGHATVALALNTMDRVHKVSIVPRSIGALGYTLQRPTEDRYLVGREELMAKIAVLLGGRGAERVFLHDVSTGAADDFAKATDIARAMITRYGMSGRIGLASLERQTSPYLSGPFAGMAISEISEQTKQIVDGEVRALLDASLTLAEETLRANAEFLQHGVARLLETETLDEKEIRSLWDRLGSQSRGPAASGAA